LWDSEGSLGAVQEDRAGRAGGQAEDQVGGDGARSGPGIGTEIGTDIEAEPYEPSDAAQADLVGTESGGVTGGYPGHFSEVVDGSKFHVAWARQLAHGFEVAGDTLATRDAGLGTASEDFFDGVESGMVDAFSEGQVEGVGRGNVIERQHLKGFEDGKRNPAGGLDRGGIEGRSDGASPLQREGVGDFLFSGKAEFFDPFTDFSVMTQRRGPADVRDRAPDLVALERRWT